MASLKEMRNRISSVKATQKITKAMQMVAAAKLRRSQDAAESARPYARRMASVIANLAAGVSGAEAPAMLAGTGSDKRHLLIVATADRGLAGGFNGSIVRLAREKANSLIAEGKDVKIVAVGKKGREQLRRAFGDRFLQTFDLGKTIDMSNAQAVGDVVVKAFDDGQVDVVTLIYSRFRSVVLQQPTAQQLIPASFEAGADAPDMKGAGYGNSGNAPAAEHRRPDSVGTAGESSRLFCRSDDCDGQCDPQCRRHDCQLHPTL